MQKQGGENSQRNSGRECEWVSGDCKDDFMKN